MVWIDRGHLANMRLQSGPVVTVGPTQNWDELSNFTIISLKIKVYTLFEMKWNKEKSESDCLVIWKCSSARRQSFEKLRTAVWQNFMSYKLW